MAKILLVEDDKSLREIYGVRLMAEGYEIVSAGDGEEALAMAIKERPDLIVSDVMMPKISGFDMLDILRSTTETKNVKVIMMTALSSEDQRARGESLGADRYLVKSQVGIEDVVRTVHDVLEDGVAAPAPAPVTATVPDTAAPAPVPETPLAPTTSVDTSIAPAPELPEAPVAPAPIEAPVIPEPVVAPVFEAPAPAVDPIPELPPQPAAFAPAPAEPAFPSPEPAPVETPAFGPIEQPAPVNEPAFEAPIPAPAESINAPTPPAPVFGEAPTPAPAEPAFPAPAPALAFPPAPAPVVAPEPSLPQPTAPFSTPAPASIGERVIAPLESANPAEATGIPDISSQMEQALNTPGVAQAPNAPQNPTL